MAGSFRIDLLAPTAVAEVVDVLCDSFHDYPVMRFVLGASEDYGARLKTLVNLFVMSRLHRDEWMLGATDGSRLVGVALVSNPGRQVASADLDALREQTWRTLREDARKRYEAFGAAASRFDPGVPHLHLNMIGVLPSTQGHGVGKALLADVHEHSRSTPWSEGVSLSTEVEANVDLYTRFGYHVMGSTDVEGAFTTWAMYRKEA